MSNMDRTTFINAMRGVAQSVTVVTTDGPLGRHGTTVSAFCSVSADPPTALVCLNASSKISEMVLGNRYFNINVLPHDAKYIADRFAGAHDKTIEDRFDNIALDTGTIPTISGAAVFRCELDQTLLSGSHQIVIGKVLGAQNLSTHPLTYLDGNYHHIVPANNKNIGGENG